MSLKFILDQRFQGTWLHGWDDLILDGWDTAKIRKVSSPIRLNRGVPCDSLDISPGRMFSCRLCILSQLSSVSSLKR